MADNPISNVSVILGAFIVVIVGLAILTGGVTENIGTVTKEVTVENKTITAPAANVSYELLGQSTRSVLVTNATGGETISSGNYTLNNYVLSNGNLVATITPKDTPYQGRSWNVSYIYEPYGYITSSGGRSMASLILVFGFLSIALIALIPSLREKIFG